MWRDEQRRSSSLCAPLHVNHHHHNLPLHHHHDHLHLAQHAVHCAKQQLRYLMRDESLCHLASELLFATCVRVVATSLMCSSASFTITFTTHRSQPHPPSPAHAATTTQAFLKARCCWGCAAVPCLGVRIRAPARSAFAPPVHLRRANGPARARPCSPPKKPPVSCCPRRLLRIGALTGRPVCSVACWLCLTIHKYPSVGQSRSVQLESPCTALAKGRVVSYAPHVLVMHVD